MVLSDVAIYQAGVTMQSVMPSGIKEAEQKQAGYPALFYR